MDKEENYGDEWKEKDLRKRRGAKEKGRSRSRDRSSQTPKRVKTREDEDKGREGGIKKTSETLQKLNISQPLDSGMAASLHEVACSDQRRTTADDRQLFNKLKEELKGTGILHNWEQIIKVFMPLTEKANKTVWAIKELHNLEEVTDMTLDAIHMIQRRRPLSKDDFKTIQRKFAGNPMEDDQSNISKVLQLAALGKSQNENVPSDLGYQRFMIMKQFWKSVMRKLLPDYPALIEAIQFLHTIDGTELTDVSALAAFQQINRFSEMGVTSMSQFHIVVQELSKCSNQEEGLVSLQSFNLEKEEVDYQYALYDVVLQMEMPHSEEEKKSMMSEIKDYLESIKTDKCLQNYVIAKQNLRSIEALNWITKFDWNDLQIEVINIFFGFQTHCLIKIRTNNPLENYDLQTIQNINMLIKLHIENIDTFTKRKFKIQKTNNWRGENTGEISVKLTWDESMFGGQSSKEDIKEAAIDIIRKIPSEIKSAEQRQNLKDKLTCEHGIFPHEVDELLKQFEMIPAMTERDTSEISIELSRHFPSPMRTIFSNIPLWPYMERKLNEIDDAQIRTGFKGACSNEDLPESISKEFINNIDLFGKNEKLYDKAFEEVAKGGYPFNTIFNIYRDHGGTFGGWIDALEKVRDKPQKPSKRAFENDESRRQVLESIITKTMDLYNDWYKRWEAKYENLPKLITNYDEFVDKFRSHGISNFQRMCRDELTSKLEVADQIWLFRERFGGYAHVLFYLGHFPPDNGNATFDQNHYVVHSHQNIGLTTYKGNSRIQKDKLEDVIGESDRCFIVRMPNMNSEEKEEAQKKALACVNPELEPIIFSYNGYSGNCESCVNAFFGLWDDEVTSQQGSNVASGSASMSMKTIAKTLTSVTKRSSDDDLRDKMKARFQQQQIDT